MGLVATPIGSCDDSLTDLVSRRSESRAGLRGDLRSFVRTKGFAITGLVAVVLVASLAKADARTDYIVRLLKTSSSFRVRAQAALSLGRVGNSNAAVVRDLSQALRDNHPAVRSAAAVSLGEIRNTSAIPALRAASLDSDRTVRQAAEDALARLERVAPIPTTTTATTQAPSGSGRYYVGVGNPGSSVSDVDRETLRNARQFLADQISHMEGIVLAPEGETNTKAATQIRQRHLIGYYIDSSVVRLDAQADGTHATVSLIVGTYPGRDMRAILQGKATVPGATGPSARRMALEGAFHGALRRLPQALQAGEAQAREGG